MKTKLTKKSLAVAAAVAGLGLVVSPTIASAVSDTEPTTINAVVDTVISVTTSTTVNVNLTPTSAGVTSSSSDTVTTSTNNAAGYTLSLANTDATTTLVKGAETIAAHSGTQTTPTNLAVNTWGYRVDSIGGFGAGPTTQESNVASSAFTWAGVPAAGSGNTIRTQASEIQNQTTTVWYGVRVDLSKESGTYTDTVTYTGTTS